ncbi:MAG: adenosylmethionine--8-amino-7-oxononanoate transaminase [Candidatus Dormibacteraeota bacterium]|nr:adenosylmethionine--8-amino-7-oxononanoate transaminase [Candidatus Dormibacteraeota bacterium]
MVAAAIAGALQRRGLRVDALKLVATGVERGTAGEDAELLATATGHSAPDSVLATFALPRSPRAAAAAEGASIDVDGLIARVRERANDADVLVLEGAGGILVPLTSAHTIADVLRSLDADTVIVGRAGLGTINHCALTVTVARERGLRVAGVILSDSEGVDAAFAAENAAQIATQCDVAVLGVIPRVVDTHDVERLAAACAAAVDLDRLLNSGDAAPHRARVMAADRAHVWHPFTQTGEWFDEEPPVIRSGEGCWLIDENGRRYLDGVASLWANVHGHAHPVLDRALHEQVGRVAHSTFLGQTHAPGALLAEELAQVTPRGLSRVFYSEAGAAAVEVALRIALLAQQRRGHIARTRFLSLEEAYHGDTAGSVSVGRSEPFHRGLDPLLFDAVRVPAPHHAGEDESLRALEDILGEEGDTLAAFIVEPRMQGAAGMLPHSDGWLAAAVGRARSAGLVVICDEVATGFGRTGDLFACGGAGVEPDILTLGKALSGGYLPLSATVVAESLFELFTGPYAEHRTLYYGHTYSGNPLACAVARASLALFASEHTVERGRELAATLSRELAQLETLPLVHEIRRRGVMAGVELRDESGTPFAPALRMGRRVTLAARRRGLIVRPLGDVVVINPPLVMSAAEAARLAAILGESLREVGAQTGG